MESKDLLYSHLQGREVPCVLDRVFYIPQRAVPNTEQSGFNARDCTSGRASNPAEHLSLKDRDVKSRISFLEGEVAWEHPLFFGNSNPVRLEYCSGNGAWILAKALQEPHVNWIAVERKFSRVKKIWAKIKNNKINNLLILFGEGFFATQHFFPSRSISEIFINFPDPWPKRRHAKNRIIQDSFISEMDRCLKVNGKITIVTDNPEFSEWTIFHMNRQLKFESIHPEPYFITEKPNYGTSYFEELWRQKGLTIRYHEFRKYLL